jgi:hypothetical protein
MQVARGARQIRVAHHLADRLDGRALPRGMRTEAVTQAVERPGRRDAESLPQRDRRAMDALAAGRVALGWSVGFLPFTASASTARSG